jgi:cyclohexyl-isocyanide hydratase
MVQAIITEMRSHQLQEYKLFLQTGLHHDEESFRITPADDSETSFPTRDREDSFTLGAYVENKLAGVVSFTRDGADREKLRHKGILFRMYVTRDFRGHGIAKELIEALLKRVRQIKDIEQVNLTVVASNATAKKMYEKFGFTTFGSESNAIKWKGKYFTEDQMVLQLKGD